MCVLVSTILYYCLDVTLSHKFRSKVPWENHYADDIVINADSLEECDIWLLIWNESK